MLNAAAYENSRPDGIGVLEIVNGTPSQEGRPRQFVPLKRTELRGEVAGPLAALRLTQVYGYSREQCDKALEAIYRFPLPGDAAVTRVRVRFGEVGLDLPFGHYQECRNLLLAVTPLKHWGFGHIGGHVIFTRLWPSGRNDDHRREVEIRAELQERRQAEAGYEEAKRQGRQAALLTRESPNVFTLQVAGIQPDQEVAVETSYIQLARAEGPGWSLRIPLTTAPRAANRGCAGMEGHEQLKMRRQRWEPGRKPSIRTGDPSRARTLHPSLRSKRGQGERDQQN